MPIIKTKPCPFCGETSSVIVSPQILSKLRHPSGKRTPGRYLQSILPDWTPTQRELLISGTHPECWEKLIDTEMGE